MQFRVPCKSASRGGYRFRDAAEPPGRRRFLGSSTASAIRPRVLICIHFVVSDAAIVGDSFNNYGFTLPATCYLRPKGIERIDPFLPVLETLTKTGASLFVAFVTLNLLEVSIRPNHLQFFLTAVNAWLDSYDEDTFLWVDYGIGQRVCKWIEHVHTAEPEMLNAGEPARENVDRILAALVRLGIADAKRLEETLAG